MVPNVSALDIIVRVQVRVNKVRVKVRVKVRAKGRVQVRVKGRVQVRVKVRVYVQVKGKNNCIFFGRSSISPARS